MHAAGAFLDAIENDAQDAPVAGRLEQGRGDVQAGVDSEQRRARQAYLDRAGATRHLPHAQALRYAPNIVDDLLLRGSPQTVFLLIKLKLRVGYHVQ